MRRLSLHLGNTAGVAWNLCDGLHQLGFSNLVIDLEPQAAKFSSHLTLKMTRETPRVVRAIHFARIARLAETSEVVHFHFGIRPFARYLRRICRAPFFVHYHGSDLREGIADAFRELAVHEFVATPDLLRLAPRATWVPNPVSLPELPPPTAGPFPVVGHFPTNPGRKGTALIQREVDALQKEIDFEFRTITGVSHTTALDEMRKCDIVIDQVSKFGSYGMIAIEGMAFGKIVLSSIDTSYYDRCPIITVQEDTLKKRLAQVLASRDDWTSLAAAGREYAARVHSPERAASVVLAEYNKWLH